MFMLSAKPEAIREKLADCLAQQRALETDLPCIALEAVETDNDAPAYAAIAKLGTLRSKQQLLEQAIVAAELAAIAARDAQVARERKARQRACAQHAAATDRAARQVSVACEALIGAWAELTKCASSLEASLGTFQMNEAGAPLLGTAALRQEVLAALYRFDAPARPTLFNRKPGTFDYEHTGDTLEGGIALLTHRAKASFDPTLPTPLLTTSPTPMDEPAAEVAIGPCAPAAGIASEPEPEPEEHPYSINVSSVPASFQRPTASEGVN
jgi:hypothetical protein